MTREDIIEYAETLDGAAYDKPFTEAFDTTVLRHPERSEKSLKRFS